MTSSWQESNLQIGTFFALCWGGEIRTHVEPTTLSTAYQAEEIHPNNTITTARGRSPGPICLYWCLSADFGRTESMYLPTLRVAGDG